MEHTGSSWAILKKNLGCELKGASIDGNTEGTERPTAKSKKNNKLNTIEGNTLLPGILESQWDTGIRTICPSEEVIEASMAKIE